jgi:hypothetical protein
VRVGEVQAHQTWQFTSNMLEFIFKSDLFFTTMGSTGAQVGKFRCTKHGSLARICLKFYLNWISFLPI